MSTQDTQRRRNRRETSFITTSGGLLTEQLLYKLRNEACSEEAVALQTFAIGDAVPESDTAVESDISEAWETLVERWDEISRDNSVFGMEVSDIRNQWLLKLFDALGFEPEFQQSNLEASGIEANLSHLGWPPQHSVQAAGSDFDGVPPVLHMTQPDADHRLDDGDHAGTGTRQKSPHDELQTYLNASSEVQWSIVTDGLKLRVLRDFYHTYTRGYVEFDLENIFTNRNFNDFRALYRLCHASRFTSEGEDDERPVESLYQVSIATGVKVGEDLQSNVVEALETLGNGFLTPEIREALEEGGQDVADAYYQDQLRIVYRLLFLLFAEQRGMMADRGDLYTDEYSVSALRERAERQSVRDSATDLWEGLQVTFELVGEGHDGDTLHVPGYNGGLFDDENLSFVDTATCPNHALLDAVHNLTHVEQEGYQQRISYADLGVDEIGAVYESLLEFTPQYATEVPELEERDISRGEFYLDSRGMERKETGSYYTKPELVDELIDSALKPVVEERVGAAESVEAKEEALLDIDVCDPACGSGAFLIAANNFLGKRLAEIRTESAYPDEQELRQARRSVVQHCIYGVDLNPMAVELAKVSLWINSAVENQPLSFLDHRIKQGNSLIGTTEELVSSGVPVDAYETSSGRDWHVGNDIRKRVRKENKNIPDSDKEVQAGLDWSSFSSEQEFVNLAEEIEALGEDSITAVERKAELYDEFEDSESLNRERLAFDVWTAAFYWPLDGSASEYPSPNTIEKVRRVVAEEFTDIDGDLGDMCARARELSETHSFFHWELEFPLVYDGGGFDCIIGNPPWETLEVKEKEFFRVKNPDISEANTQSQRKSLIEDLSDTDPELYSKFRNYEKQIENTSKFISKSGRFGLSAKGKINLYAPFTEHGLTNISSMGRCGILVPTGIATDYNTQDFFGEIISERKLVSLFDFVNKKHLFEGIPEDQRFCLLTLAGSNNKQSQFNFSFQNLSVDKSIIRESAYSLSKEQIMSVNPNTLNCPIFSSEQDKTITLEIYKDTPVLMNDMNETNTWNITYHTLFNAASDSDLFEENTLEELKSEGYELDSLNQFIKEDQTLLPVWEAKFIHQFDHRHGTFEGIPRDKRFARRAGTNEVSDSEKSNTEYEITPRYWMDAEYLNKRLSDIGWDEDWFFSFRDIVRVTSDIRVAKGTICPRYPLVHTAPILSFDCEEKPEQALVFTSLFTSLSFEFALRQSLAGAHITKYILKQLPMPEPSRIRNADIQIKGEKMNLWSTLVEYSAKLTWTSKSLNDFGKEIKCVDGPYKWDQEERIELRGIIDAAVAKLYRLDRDEFEYILDSYDALERSDQAEHGRFITKENTLEKFDQISLIE